MSSVDTQFELEQNIMNCWSVVDDVNTIYEYISDSAVFKDMDPVHTDKIANLLLGITSLYQIKFEKCFASYEQYIKEVRNG